MNTPTPETDAESFSTVYQGNLVYADFARKLERELTAMTEQRDEWKSKYIQQNKDLSCEQMDPDGTIWDYAKKVQSDLSTMTEQRDGIEAKLRIELRGHPDSELWGEAGLIAATMRCVDAHEKATEQRDRLAEALSLAGKLCHVVHHPKSMQHETFDPCPVEALIKQALSKPNQPTEP